MKRLWASITWEATSAIASAISSIATLGIVWLTYLQLSAANAATAAAQRNETLSELSGGVQRFETDARDALPLLQVLNNVSANRRARILTDDDFEFVKAYLKSHEYLKGHNVLCDAWRASRASSAELTELVEAGLQTTECTRGK